MTSIFKVLEDNEGKPLSLYEIMKLSGKAEHKVIEAISTLKKQGFLKIIVCEDGDRLLLKECVRLIENDISESKYKHYFSRIKEILSNLIFEQEKKESVRNKSIKEELAITHTHPSIDSNQHYAQNQPIVITKPPFYFYLILFFLMFFILFILGELFFRTYHWYTGEHIAADQNELCFKKMKIDNLPTDTKRRNFFNFKRAGGWEDDPVIGATLKKNYTEDKVYPIVINGEAKTVVIYGEHHYNSQGMSSHRDEFSFKKPSDVSVRIALLGDSLTCGDQAPLLFNMGSVLKELIPKSEVLNFCVPGKGIDTMYARYVIDAKKYTPSVVFFNVLIDDIQRPFGGCQIETPNLTVNNGRIVIGPRKYPTLQDFYEKYPLPKFESYFIKHILWVYDKNTRYHRNMRQGYDLFNVMLDNLKEQTKEQNATFIVSLIQSDSKQMQTTDREYYDKSVQLLKAKNVTYFDSEKYFQTKRVAYRNQSFYYLQGLYKQDETIGHFSPIGSALFAQGMKNTLEDIGRLNKTTNYNFANFDENMQLLYLIPEDVNLQLQGHIRTISPFEFRDANYTANLRIDYLQVN